jgi:hypothetical protein
MPACAGGQGEICNQLPWPTNANGTGASLQLIDPHQDNWRVGNWAAVLTNTPAVTPQWVYVTATGTRQFLLALHLSAIRRRRLCGRHQAGRRQRAGSGREHPDQRRF